VAGRSRTGRSRSWLGLALAALTAGALALTPVLTDTRDGKARALQSGDLETTTVPIVPTQASCTNGQAGPYHCDGIDLLAIVPTAEIGLGTVSDLWGWTDPVTGHEWAIVTTGFGVAFVDVTTPTSPIVAARMPIQREDPDRELWRDVKVYEDRAYVVTEHGGYGMHVFDLTRLRDIPPSPLGTVMRVSADHVYDGFGKAHNIAINDETGYAYAVGTDTCDGGLHMIDLKRPEPTFVGCFAEDGYTHDVQCVIYRGEHARYRNKEICFASNEDTVTIVDVTSKANPKLLSRTTYDTASYTHQGWLTPDHGWFIFGDETDEMTGTTVGTATYILRVDDLEDPGEVATYTHDTLSIDHNLYVRDDLVYEANYTAGIRVLRWSDELLEQGELEPVAYLDTAPAADVPAFAGTWTVYPFFESGTLITSDFNTGLVVARLADDGPADDAG
jgi:choice-of-anchor B domain-containing protein